MSEDLSHLIEIGDPEVDPVVPGPAPDPQVVIEYRDRGLPWMLVLPLLVTAGAAAIIGFKAFDDRVRPAVDLDLTPPTLAVAVAETPPPPPRIVPDEVERDPSGMPIPPPSPIALPLASLPPEVNVPPGPPAATVPEAPAVAPPAVAEVPPAAPTADSTPPVEEPRPFPQVAGLGFDPDALTRAEVKPDDVQPAGNPANVPEEVRPAVGPDDPDQPRTVDPRDLPRDPRQAQRDRMLRWVETRRQLDLDRARFHADLLAICRRFGERAAPAIADLCRRYGAEPDPIAKAQAARMLTVAAAGADPKVRINLLRKYGFPEASILLDIVENKARWEDGSARNGPRSKDDILRMAALYLLRCPPRGGTAPTSPTAASPARRPAGSVR